MVSSHYACVRTDIPSSDPANYPDHLKDLANEILKLNRDDIMRVWHLVTVKGEGLKGKA